MNVELVDHQALEAIEKENQAKNRKKGKNVEKKQQAAVNVGEVAWDKMFAEGSFDLTPKRFMVKIKAAVSKADFQLYMKMRYKHSLKKLGINLQLLLKSRIQ